MIQYDGLIEDFIRSAHRYKVKMIMVGGAAVNFHGYQRHSADVDFWIKLSDENLNRLKKALNAIGYEYKFTPLKVQQGMQNISVKINPFLEIELITRFSTNKSFEETYRNSHIKKIRGDEIRVISLEDLLDSKAISGRDKDLLDIKRLKEINNLK